AAFDSRPPCGPISHIVTTRAVGRHRHCCRPLLVLTDSRKGRWRGAEGGAVAVCTGGCSRGSRGAPRVPRLAPPGGPRMPSQALAPVHCRSSPPVSSPFRFTCCCARSRRVGFPGPAARKPGRGGCRETCQLWAPWRLLTWNTQRECRRARRGGIPVI